MDILHQLSTIWESLYPDEAKSRLNDFVQELTLEKRDFLFSPHENEWYKDAVIYSLYVDLFNRDFPGLEAKLDYLKDLGVNCLWLLPILDSPMRDAGFDIRDYRKLRDDLTGGVSDPAEQIALFSRFLEKAHHKGIRVIFDIAINHTSEEHPWFLESASSKDNPYRDYYIWSDEPTGYSQARIIFQGLCESNWEKRGESYFFHRFFEFQPDLNYRNPEVLFAMCRHMIFWLKQGVDGFRADAIPYLWKEEGTDCENLPQTHLAVKFFRAILEFLRPGTLLLAEACQKPAEVVKYFGNGDECNAGYHFPLMPQIFKTVAAADNTFIRETLSPAVTPSIPETAQWLTFLRCHDELSLELVYVTEEDRKYIHDHYCKTPQWNFRKGQGISARLSELMDRNPEKIGLIFSIMLTLPGTPVIYYGDESGKLNDEEYYREAIRLTGKDDTRFLVRGHIDWNELSKAMDDPFSLQSRVFTQVRTMIHTRNKHKTFGRGRIEWIRFFGKDEKENLQILAFIRAWENEKILVIHNLTGRELWIHPETQLPGEGKELLGREIIAGHEPGHMRIKPFGYHWIKFSSNH